MQNEKHEAGTLPAPHSVLESFFINGKVFFVKEMEDDEGIFP